MKHIQKPVSVLLTLIMVLGLFTVVPFSAGALDGVSYIDENGESQTANGVTVVTSDMTTFQAGWYAVTSNITNNNRIICTGDVHLILCDGAKLTSSKGIEPSIDINITIYGQSGGTGELEITGAGQSHCAALGGENNNDITINGGNIKVTTDVDYGAAIGSGQRRSSVITINGGNITATGGKFGAAIGSGDLGSSTVIINGGNITATGNMGAAIGCGSEGRSAVTINGGVVSATSVGQGSGIGEGKYDNCEATVSLNWTNKTDSITASSYKGTITLKKQFHDGASINEVGTVYEAGAVSDNSTLTSKTLRPYYDLPGFMGHSISLNGDIGLNYYLNEVSEGTDLHFEWYNKTYDHTVTAADYDATSGYYKVTVNVAAAEMTCPITATCTDGYYLVTDVFSVRNYSDMILDRESDFSKGYVASYGAGKYGALVDLIKKMLDFGAKAQTRFGVTDFDLANTGIDYTMQPATVYHIKTKKTEMEDENLYKYGLNYIGTSILFLSGMTLRHNYAVTDEYLLRNIKDTANFDFVDKGARVCFERKNIPAAQFDVDFTFTLGESTYRYSVLDYCKLVIADENKPQADRELAMATFWYNDAAKTYFYYSDEYEEDIV